MKTIIKQLFLRSILCVMGFLWFANATATVSYVTHYNFSVGGVFYRITSSSTVSVTYEKDAYYTASSKYDDDDDWIVSGYDEDSVLIPSSVTYNSNNYKVTAIDYNAFDSSDIKFVSLPNSIIEIGSGAFQDCGNLENIALPQSVNSIGSFAFNGCIKLSSVNIPEGITTIESGTFSACRSLTSITIPNSVTSIDFWAFPGCTGLTEITIPNSVTSIGSWAFSGCMGLTAITIPNSVTSIGSGAFSGCSDLTSVTVMKETPVDIDASTFSNREKATLIVPNGCKKAYEATEFWNEFKVIVELEDESNNSLYASEIEALVGTRVVLPIELVNKNEVKLCQFDLHLPYGVTVATKSNGNWDAKLTKRAGNHSVTSSRLANGDYRFIISSMDNDSFTGNEGTLMEITLDIPATMEAGEYTVKVMNVELSVPDGNDLIVVRPTDTESKLTVKSYMPGDVNNDGSVSVTDAGCAINYILEQVPSVFIFEAADMNGDKSVSVTDVGLIINYILSEGATASRKIGQQTMTDVQLSLMPIADGYELLLENKDNFIGFQFDLELANGTAIGGVRLTGATDDDHQVTYRQLSNGKWRVVCYSPTNSAFAGGVAGLLNILATGEMTISDIRLTTTAFDELRPASLVGTATGIANVEQESMKISVKGQTLCITSERETTLQLYTLDGRICRKLHLRCGQNTFDGLRAGIYMINNQKVILR